MVNPSTDTSTLKQQQPFTKGTQVEVSSDDEGFRGAWYSATILEIPPKSASKKRKKALIRYKTLLANDGSSPLTEHVDPAYIRPLPPNEKGSAQQFEVNDVVDASYRDGWWTGVVRKVLENSRYRVYFDNPPDVIEFDRKDLRVHWNWVDCKWVRPEKQIGIALCTQNGKVVGELQSSLSTKENTEDKIPLTKMNKNAVEKSTSTDENNALNTSKKKVKPETSNGNTSRSQPSKKLTEGNAVETPISVTCDKLKDMPSGTLCKEDTPRTGGKGAKSSRKAVIGDENCAKIESPTTGAKTQTASNDCLFCQHHRSNWTTKRHKAGSADGTANNLLKRNVRVRKSPSKGSQVPAAGTDGTALIVEEGNEREIKTKEVEMAIVIGLTAFKSFQSENSLQIPSEEPLKLMGNQKNNLNDSVRNENKETKEHKAGASDLKRKRGRPGSSLVTSPKASDAGKEQNGAGGITDEKAVKDCMSNEACLSKHKGMELLGTWGI